MHLRSLRHLVAAVLVSIAASSAIAQPDDDPKSPKEPLPEGAVQRFGLTRPILRNNPVIALVAPAYSDFVAPTMTGSVRRYSLETGKPLQKDGIVESGQVAISADGKRAAVGASAASTSSTSPAARSSLPSSPPSASVSSACRRYPYRATGRRRLWLPRQEQQVDGGRLGRQSQRGTGHPRNRPARQRQSRSCRRDGKLLVTHGTPGPPLLPLPGTPIKTPKIVPNPANEPAPDMERVAQVWEVVTGKAIFRARVSGMGGNATRRGHRGGQRVRRRLRRRWSDRPVGRRHLQADADAARPQGQGVHVAIAPDGKTVASVAVRLFDPALEGRRHAARRHQRRAGPDSRSHHRLRVRRQRADHRLDDRAAVRDRLGGAPAANVCRRRWITRAASARSSSRRTARSRSPPGSMRRCFAGTSPRHHRRGSHRPPRAAARRTGASARRVADGGREMGRQHDQTRRGVRRRHRRRQVRHPAAVHADRPRHLPSERGRANRRRGRGRRPAGPTERASSGIWTRRNASSSSICPAPPRRPRPPAR